MKTTEVMMGEKEIWAGLNHPEIDEGEAEVLVLGIPYDGAVSFRGGASAGPRALRGITYTITPTTERFENFEDLLVKDLGDMVGETRDEIFAKTEEVIEGLVKRGQFFTMIGGDHSTTIPILRGINKAVEEEFGIIHIDAHFDLCNDMDGDQLSHGSTQRRALELNHIGGIENLFFLGIRSIEMDELEFSKENSIQVVGAAEVDDIGVEATLERVRESMEKFNKIYLTIDIDCLDPAYAAGTGTPQFGGLTSRQLLNLLKGLFKLPIIGFDVVEVAPKLDPSLTALFAARKIVTECWGHQYKKLRG